MPCALVHQMVSFWICDDIHSHHNARNHLGVFVQTISLGALSRTGHMRYMPWPPHGCQQHVLGQLPSHDTAKMLEELRRMGVAA